RCAVYFFFFNDTATTEIYTLSLHDALPILCVCVCEKVVRGKGCVCGSCLQDRKSTRLNSSHTLNLVCRLLLEKKQTNINQHVHEHAYHSACAVYCVTLST